MEDWRRELLEDISQEISSQYNLRKDCDKLFDIKLTDKKIAILESYYDFLKEQYKIKKEGVK